MRKVLLTGLIAALIMGALSYSLMWWMQANNARKITEDLIARANAKEKLITYDSVSIGGFPLKIRVSINQPHLSGRVDQWMRSLMADTAPSDPGSIKVAGMIERMPEWHEDLKLDGTISVAINMLSDSYEISLDGNLHSKGKIGDQTFDLVTTQEGTASCHLNMAQRSGALLESAWDFRLLTHSGMEQAPLNFREFACDLPARLTTEVATQQPVMSSGPARLAIVAAPQQGKNYTISLKAVIRDSVVLPRMDSIIDAYMQALGETDEGAQGLRWSAYGKQNVDVEMHYSGPQSFSTDGVDASISLEVPRFVISNDLYNVNVTHSLYNEAKGDSRAMRLTFKGETYATPAYYTLLGTMVRRLISEFYAENDEAKQTLPPELAKLPPDELYALFEPVIPRLHEFGQITESANIAFNGKRDYSAGALEINDLSFNSQLYSMRVGGSLKLDKAVPVPTGALTVQWRSGLRMVDDVLAYLARLERVVALASPEEAKTLRFEPSFGVSLKSFLSALAAGQQSPDADTLVYNVAADSPATFNINGKDIPALNVLYLQYFPQETAPAAAGDETATSTEGEAIPAEAAPEAAQPAQE